MGDSGEGWFSAAACRTRAWATPAASSPARFRDLPARTKIDLGSIAVAGIASTLLMLAAVVAPRPADPAAPAAPPRVSATTAPVLLIAVPGEIVAPLVRLDENVAELESPTLSDFSEPQPPDESTPAASR